MSQESNRRTKGIIFLAVGFLVLAAYLTPLPGWPYSIGLMGSMMGRGAMTMPGLWNYPMLETASGTVVKVRWMEIELEANGEEVKAQGPPWLWLSQGTEAGYVVTAKGVLVPQIARGGRLAQQTRTLRTDHQRRNIRERKHRHPGLDASVEGSQQRSAVTKGGRERSMTTLWLGW